MAEKGSKNTTVELVTSLFRECLPTWQGGNGKVFCTVHETCKKLSNSWVGAAWKILEKFSAIFTFLLFDVMIKFTYIICWSSCIIQKFEYFLRAAVDFLFYFHTQKYVNIKKNLRFFSHSRHGLDFRSFFMRIKLFRAIQKLVHDRCFARCSSLNASTWTENAEWN